MNPAGITDILAKGSPSFRKLNVHLLAPQSSTSIFSPSTEEAKVNTSPATRIRQHRVTKMNALESRFFDYLRFTYPGVIIRSQAKSYRLANGINYRPDFTAVIDGREMAWETKGPKAFRGGFENLKVAADRYREITWTLAWEDGGHGKWQFQTVLADAQV